MDTKDRENQKRKINITPEQTEQPKSASAPPEPKPRTPRPVRPAGASAKARPITAPSPDGETKRVSLPKTNTENKTPAAPKTARPVTAPKAAKPADNVKKAAGSAASGAAARTPAAKTKQAARPVSPSKTGAAAATQAARDDATVRVPVSKPQNRPAQPKISASSPVTEETVIFSDEPAKLYKGKIPALEDTQPVMIHQQKNRITSLFKPREKKPNLVLSIVLNVIKLMFVVVIVAVSVGFGSVIGVANAYLETTPELDTGKIEDQNLTSYIYDQSGNLLATYSGKENRDWASIDDIPTDLQNAVIAIEDVRFYDHTGVDFRRLAGAFAANLSSGGSQGGSTITQQLVKNKLLTSERSYKRKLQEAYLAMKLEEKYTKDEILEAYLNSIPLGGRVYGVRTAAKDYFGKELDELTLKEMVCIAAITQSTTKFNPRRATYQKPEDLPYLINRMNMITERMYWNDMITKEQYDATYTPSDVYLSSDSVLEKDSTDGKLDLKLAPGYLPKWKAEMKILEASPANETYKYPHFVEYVIHDVQTFMLKDKGMEDTEENRRIVDREMRASGYKIYATIDPKIQEAVQSTLSEWDSYPSFQNSSDNVITQLDANGNPQEVIQPQAAATVVDNATGYLVAIVGSRDEPDQMLTFNRAYEGRMQIGSSIKPIAVYGPAFDIGYSLTSNVANLRVPITGWTVTDKDPGYPQTSQGDERPASLHESIVNSWNIAASRVLADFVTIPTSLTYLENLGVDTSRFLDPTTGVDNRTIVGLALGSAPITPVEVAGAYSAIPRGGEYRQPMSFNLVRDSNDNTIIDMEEQQERHQGFKQTTAWMLNQALTDAVDHGTGTNANIPGMTTAGKTGSVVDNKGAFFAGYTPYYTSALWVGSDAYKSFTKSSGGGLCAPIWRTYMEKIHEGKTDKEIFPGDPSFYGMVKGRVCKYSNLKLTSRCDPTEEDWMAISDVPTMECNICGQGGGGYSYCSETGMRATEFCPSTYGGGGRKFPEGSAYALKYGTGGGGGGSSSYCTLHNSDWYWGGIEVAPVDTPPPGPEPVPDPNPAPEPDPNPPAPETPPEEPVE